MLLAGNAELVVSTCEPFLILRTNSGINTVLGYRVESLMRRSIGVLCGPQSDIQLLFDSVRNSALHVATTMQVVMYNSVMLARRMLIRVIPVEEDVPGLPVISCRINIAPSDAVLLNDALQEVTMAHAILSSVQISLSHHSNEKECTLVYSLDANENSFSELATFHPLVSMNPHKCPYLQMWEAAIFNFSVVKF